jgi:hypothetical protein
MCLSISDASERYCSAKKVCLHTLISIEQAFYYLIILFVVVYSGGMGHDDVVSSDVGFPLGVTAVAVPEWRGAVVGRVHP